MNKGRAGQGGKEREIPIHLMRSLDLPILHTRLKIAYAAHLANPKDATGTIIVLLLDVHVL